MTADPFYEPPWRTATYATAFALLVIALFVVMT